MSFDYEPQSYSQHSLREQNGYSIDDDNIVKTDSGLNSHYSLRDDSYYFRQYRSHQSHNFDSQPDCRYHGPSSNWIDQQHKKYATSVDVKIPKIIMQTWKNHKVPKKWRGSPKSIKDQMSDWKYVLMTDEDNEEFCRRHFPDFLPYYKLFPHSIQRADAIRYMWLYVHGGVYMDLDIVVVKPLDDLFYSDSGVYLCSSGNIGSCLTNSFMASKPGHPLWLDMIEHMKETKPWWCHGKHMEVMNTTGPLSLNWVVKEYGHSYQSLSPKLVMPCSVCNIESCDIGNSYLKPLVGSSWVSWDTKVMNFFMCKWRTIVLIIIIIIFLILIIFLYHYYRPTKRSKQSTSSIIYEN